MKVIAYVDESGDPSFNFQKKGVTKYFVVTCILIEPANIDGFISGANKIRTDYFSGSEIKSSSVSDHFRRKEILSSINNLDFKSYSIAIDKREVDKNSGLVYKKPFIKYINGLLYRKLFRSYSSVEVFCDQHGYPEFQKSFKIYLLKHHNPDLFSETKIYSVDSKEYVGVQIADFIAGSIRSSLDKKTRDLIPIIRANSAGIEIWPPRKGYISIEDVKGNDDDEVIEQYCLAQVKLFLEENINTKDEDKLLQLAVLEYLLSKYYDETDYKFTYTKGIMKAVRYNSNDKSDYYFRTKIIGGLRDAGVIIASSSKGLKIPTSVKDLSGFVDESFKKILPMIHRLGVARNQIKLATMGKLDIMAEKDIERKMLDFMEMNNICSSQ